MMASLSFEMMWTGKNAGCPMGLSFVSLTSNQFCQMCGTCVHNCQYKSINLDLRWRGAELWQHREPNLVASLFIPALIGSLCTLILFQNQDLHFSPILSFTLRFLASTGFCPGFFTPASLLMGRRYFAGTVRFYGFVYLPIVFSGHIAFQVPFIQEVLRWIVHIFTGTVTHDPNPILIQHLLIVTGLLWSLWILRHLYKNEA
jgi:hypothetical protein